MAKCLYCYKELLDGECDFHKRCCKKMFMTQHVPMLPYTQENIEELAKEVIRSQTTLTGVQAKLSLDICNDSEKGATRFTIVGLWGRYILKPPTFVGGFKVIFLLLHFHFHIFLSLCCTI